MKNSIVIGSFFGDENKGGTVDNLCTPDSLVVRFSGGCQAGHSVLRNGIKHVFSSYGSGTLQGCPTLFTEDTSFYLPNILIEKELLATKGINAPKLYLDPLCMSTTPFDVAYNRAREASVAHGTCGMGIGATMSRNATTGYKLFAIDFTCRPILLAKLSEIGKHYEKMVLKEFPANSLERFTYFDELETQWERMEAALLNELPFSIMKLDKIRHGFKNVVFEGSQGILLDMDHGIFPNVTYAHTTSRNALKYCDPMNAEIYYVTRCYLTRHGNGWFPKSVVPTLINNEQEINIKGKYQGEFRIGEFDYNLLNYSLNVDNIYSGNITKHLVVSCLDQRPDFVLDKSRIPDIIDTVIGNFGASNGCLREIQ